MRNVITVLKREFLDLKFARFLIFGATTAAVNLVVGGLLYSSDSADQLLPYWMAVTIGGLSALVVGFILNLYFNFRYDGRSTLAMFRTYTALALGGLALSVVLATLYLWMTMLLFAGNGFTLASQYISFEFASHFCSVGSVAVYSYLSHKYFTFNVGFRQQVQQFRNSRKRSG